jgi:hypothetical protein
MNTAVSIASLNNTGENPRENRRMKQLTGDIF